MEIHQLYIIFLSFPPKIIISFTRFNLSKHVVIHLEQFTRLTIVIKVVITNIINIIMIAITSTIMVTIASKAIATIMSIMAIMAIKTIKAIVVIIGMTMATIISIIIMVATTSIIVVIIIDIIEVITINTMVVTTSIVVVVTSTIITMAMVAMFVAIMASMLMLAIIARTSFIGKVKFIITIKVNFITIMDRQHQFTTMEVKRHIKVFTKLQKTKLVTTIVYWLQCMRQMAVKFSINQYQRLHMFQFVLIVVCIMSMLQSRMFEMGQLRYLLERSNLQC